MPELRHLRAAEGDVLRAELRSFLGGCRSIGMTDEGGSLTIPRRLEIVDLSVDRRLLTIQKEVFM